MKTETLPALIIIENLTLNFNNISYFQHGYDNDKKQHYIKFKMVCGDYVNFDYKVEEEYKDILDMIFKNYTQISGKKWVEKIVKKAPKKLKILPKNDKK